MYGEQCEIDPKQNHIPLKQYKKFIIKDQTDATSIKNYIFFMKQSVDLSDKQSINDYIDLWNLYLEVYMNDEDAWLELSKVYLLGNEYYKAIYCLEEVLLHFPRNIRILNKIGAIYLSINTVEDSKEAIKFYSQSAVILPNAEALFGIQNALEIISKKERLDQKLSSLYQLTKSQLKKLYENTFLEKEIDVEKIYNVKE